MLSDSVKKMKEKTKKKRHFLLTPMFSGENHAATGKVFPLGIRCFFSLAAFKTFSLPLIFGNLIITCLGIDFFGFI